MARGGDAVEIATEVVSEDSGTIVVVSTIGTTIDRRDSMGESADDVSLKNLEVVSTIEAAAEGAAEGAAETEDEARSVETTGTIDSIIVSTTGRRDLREETAAETDLKTLEVALTTEAAAEAARSAETTETIVHRPVARTIVSTVDESVRLTITKVFVLDRTDLSTTDDLWILEDAFMTVARASDETETETAAGPEIDARTTSKCGARTMIIVETATTIGERDRAVVFKHSNIQHSHPRASRVSSSPPPLPAPTIRATRASLDAPLARETCTSRAPRSFHTVHRSRLVLERIARRFDEDAIRLHR